MRIKPAVGTILISAGLIAGNGLSAALRAPLRRSRG